MHFLKLSQVIPKLVRILPESLPKIQILFLLILFRFLIFHLITTKLTNRPSYQFSPLLHLRTLFPTQSLITQTQLHQTDKIICQRKGRVPEREGGKKLSLSTPTATLVSASKHQRRYRKEFRGKIMGMFYSCPALYLQNLTATVARFYIFAESLGRVQLIITANCNSRSHRKCTKE